MQPYPIIWLVDLDEEDEHFFKFITHNESCKGLFEYISPRTLVLEMLKKATPPPDLILFDLDTHYTEKFCVIQLLSETELADKTSIGIIATYYLDRDDANADSLPVEYRLSKPETIAELRTLIDRLLDDLAK